MRTLIATDLSPASNEALAQGFARARATNGRVAVCTAQAIVPPLHALEPELYMVDIRAQLNDQPALADTLRKHVERVVPGETDFELFIEQGSAYAAVVERADEWQAELIVVGSHGYTGVDHALLGSVAERIVRYASCPVLVARPARRGVVLVATDLSDPALPALEAGVREARARECSLVVLHALDTQVSASAAAGALLGAIPAGLPEGALEARRQGARQLIETALERLGARGEVHVADGDPVSALKDLAEELPAALLVVGTRGRTGLKRVLLGSVAEKLIETAPCSVLAVRHSR